MEGVSSSKLLVPTTHHQGGLEPPFFISQGRTDTGVDFPLSIARHWFICYFIAIGVWEPDDAYPIKMRNRQ